MCAQPKHYCEDCEASSRIHIFTWINASINLFLVPLASLPLSFPAQNAFEGFLQMILRVLGIADLSEEIDVYTIQPRSAFFVEAARKRGIRSEMLRIFKKETEHLVLSYEGKTFRFNGPPTAREFDGPYAASAIINDKWRTKEHLAKKFPVASGKVYYWWQKKRAVHETIRDIGFPLVVKPREGSFGRHVTTRINTKDTLQRAIEHALVYQPSFVVEKYISNSSVHRVTVIDYRYVVSVRRTPPRIVGDGISTVRSLINGKNAELTRDLARYRYPLLWPITENYETDKLLREQHNAYESIPAKSEVVLLQRDPYLRLGGDVIEETDQIHPTNRSLAIEIAKHFGLHVAGIDIMLEDIARPWAEQHAAVLEINSLPCFEVHEVPTEGKPQHVAEKLVDLFLKYYVKEV